MKLAILGGAGRMGRMLIDCAKDMQIPVVAVTEIPGSAWIGQPATDGVVFQDTWPTNADAVIEILDARIQ